MPLLCQNSGGDPGQDPVAMGSGRSSAERAAGKVADRYQCPAATSYFPRPSNS